MRYNVVLTEVITERYTSRAMVFDPVLVKCKISYEVNDIWYTDEIAIGASSVNPLVLAGLIDDKAREIIRNIEKHSELSNKITEIIHAV